MAKDHQGLGILAIPSPSTGTKTIDTTVNTVAGAFVDGCQRSRILTEPSERGVTAEDLLD